MRRSSSSLPPFASLRAFEAVSRLGSVKEASDYLNVTPSAISHQLRALEAHFNLQLVQIKGRNVSLTDEGAAYAPAIIRAFAELFRANDILEGARRDPLFHVSVTPTFAMLAALPHLENFRKANPSIDLRLQARSANVDFNANEFDAAIFVGMPPFQGLAAWRLFHSRLIPLAHPKLWDDFGPIRSARDIARMPLIDFPGAPVSWRRWLADQDSTRAVGDDEPYLVSDSLLTAIQMAESGMGVILGPFPLMASRVVAGTLSPSPRRFSQTKYVNDFYFVCPTAAENASKIVSVRNWLLEISETLEREAAKLGY